MYITVVNDQKVQAKAYLSRDIQSNITNLMSASNQAHDTESSLSTVMAGTPSGTDRRWQGCFERAANDISTANTALNQAYSLVDSLDECDTEWVDDAY